MVSFIGFSTHDRKIGSATLQDKELAIRDLQNHFYTRRGERLGEPSFGSIIPQLLFDPLDQRTIDLIEEDMVNIIETDRRWQFQDYQIIEGDHTVTLTVQLIYVPDLTQEELLLEYERQENEVV